MSKTIDFYFDYSSPYGYLASRRIESIAKAHDRSINWNPILLGAIFKVSGQAPLTSYPLKGDYAVIDFSRSAREHKTPYKHPENFPIGTVAACRATYWLAANSDADMANKTGELVHAFFKAYYVDGQDLSQTEVVLATASSVGIDTSALKTALGEKAVKDQLRAAIENAIERGVFGSPTMIVDDEMFWGNDRLEQLDRWLSSGGW